MDQKHSYHSGKWITLIGFCTAMEIILARFLSCLLYTSDAATILLV